MNKSIVKLKIKIEKASYNNVTQNIENKLTDNINSFARDPNTKISKLNEKIYKTNEITNNKINLLEAREIIPKRN